jgi:hypothetical protein
VRERSRFRAADRRRTQLRELPRGRLVMAGPVTVPASSGRGARRRKAAALSVAGLIVASVGPSVSDAHAVPQDPIPCRAATAEELAIAMSLVQDARSSPQDPIMI